MAAHTPGPWHLINSVCVGGPIEPGWEEAGTGIAHCGMRARTQEEAAANARLIAAAPDMLAAIEAFVGAWDRGDTHDGHEALGMAKSALTKARGEQEG